MSGSTAASPGDADKTQKRLASSKSFAEGSRYPGPSSWDRLERTQKAFQDSILFLEWKTFHSRNSEHKRLSSASTDILNVKSGQASSLAASWIRI